MGDWAVYMGIEAVYIDKDTTIRQYKNELGVEQCRVPQIGGATHEQRKRSN